MGSAPSVTSIIWRTVVAAGAMLATPGCPSGAGPEICEPAPEVVPPTAAEAASAAGPTAGPPVPAGEPVTVLVATAPEGVEVYVDDEPAPRGTTPLQLESLSADGMMTLRFHRDGYQDARRELQRDRGYEVVVALAAETPPAPARPRCRPGRRGRGFVLA